MRRFILALLVLLFLAVAVAPNYTSSALTFRATLGPRLLSLALALYLMSHL